MSGPDPDEGIATDRRSLLTAAAGGLTAGALGTLPAAETVSAAQADDTVTIVHDTHFHGRFADSGDGEKSIGRYYGVVSDLLESHDNAAFLGNGDDLAPSVLGIEYEGEHMVDALNYMQPDAIGAGNHEFDFGVDVAESRFVESEFPWVVANLLGPDGEPLPGTERWTTVDAGDVTIGVFGLVVNRFYTITSYPEEYQVLDNVEAAAEATQALREEEDVDVVVCAAHVSTGTQETIARQTDGLDAIVGSHSGVAFDEPKEVEGTVVAEFGDEFDHVGRLTFDAGSGDLVDWERRDFYNSAADETPPSDAENHVPVDVQEVSPDAELGSLVDEYQAELEERLGEPVVEAETELNASFDNYAIETGWGNLIADLMREAADLDEEVQVAFQNAGGIRSGSTYGPGPLTGADVMNILPFPNELEVYELTGEEVHAYVENAVRPLPSQYGAQPAIQVSGVSYEWTGHDDESVVENLFVGGEPVDEGGTYLVATLDFIAGRNDMFREDNRVVGTGLFQGPYIMNKLDEEYDTIAPEREHRMIRVDEDLGAADVAGDTETVTVSVPDTEASEGVREGTYRAVSRTGDVVAAESVSEADGEIRAEFDAAALLELATAVEEPTVRLLGEFEPNDEHYGYENDEGEVADLPNSSGYEGFKLKASVDAGAVAEVAQEETETEEPATGTETEAQATETEDETPGFGAAAGAAGAAGGAYLYSKYGGDGDDADGE